jgi:hypothetical protein
MQNNAQETSPIRFLRIWAFVSDLSQLLRCRHVSIVTAPLLSLLLFASVAVQAQNTLGTIEGTITDPSGALVANAPVTLTNIGTQDTRTTVTNASGFYQFVNIPPATYRITVKMKGFKSLTRESVELQVDSTVQVSLSLELGSDTESIIVTAHSPLLQEQSTTLGTVIDQRETNEIPLNGRNPMNLVALAPSVVPQGQSMSNPNGTNPFAWGNYQIGGGMANQSVTYLDGAPVNTEYINLTSLVPTQDSLQEFKVETNNLSPQYGRLAGGAIQFSTKSGTNNLHGAVWEYLRNKVLNANTFFGNRSGLPNPAFTQNQYGFNIGGPVYIPKIYDGHNKLFFFVNWEGFSLRQGVTYTTTVPTAAELTGNLSDLNTPIYNPLTTCGTNGVVCGAGQKQYDRTQYPGAIIPTNQLNQTSLAWLKTFMPAPNVAGAAPGTPNYTATGSSGGNNYETVAHIDYNLSDKQHISGRYTWWKNINLPTEVFNGICQDRCGETFTTNDFVFGDDYAFNSKTILSLRVSYLRFVYARSPLMNNFDVTTIGQPASLQSQIQFPGPPSMSINGFDPASIFSSQGSDSTINNHTDDDRVSGNFTKFIGNHTLQFGGELLRATFNYAQTNNSSGAYTFTPGFTTENAVTGGGGLGIASYLLGYAASGNATTVIPIAAEQLYPGVYANDEWRLTSRLTLHYGVRWEDTRPFTERHDRLSYFDPTMVNPALAAEGVPNVLGAIGLVASDTRSSRSVYNNETMQFSPRVGLAFKVTPTTLFSAGYGIFWLPNDVANLPYSDPVISSSTNYNASTNNGLTPASNISNPFPGGLIAPVGRNPSFQQTLLGTNPTESFVNNPYAYAQQFNAGIQQQVGNNFVFSISWGGSKGTHLPMNGVNLNQLPDKDLSLGTALNTLVPNPFYGIINSAFSLGAPTIPAGQLLLRWPQYSGMTDGGAGLGSSTYNSLQIQAQQRFAHGGSINLAYTWAKLLSNTDTITTWLEPSVPGIQDSNNLRGEKSLSADNAAQRVVVSYVYDLPFGHGRKYLGGSSRLVDYTIGGWGLGGVTTLMTGFPLGFGTNENLTGSFGGGSRPNYVSGCSRQIRGAAVARLNEWFNTDCFTQPAPFTFGNESRLDPELRAAGVANWDTSAYKNFSIDHDGKSYVQFRAEAFNLFNRVQFGYPGLTQGESGFGIVSSQQNLPRLLQFSLRLNY